MGGFDDDEVDYVEDIKDDQSGGDDRVVMMTILQFW